MGYDYGIRPVILLAGDWEFADVWDQADYVANAYGYVSQYGILVNVPFVQMTFGNEDYGRKLFKDHLMKWVEASQGEGDAVGLDFIEFDDGHYMMVVYPQIEYVIDRLTPKHLTHDDVEVIAMVVSKAKEFVSREGYALFREAARSNAILLMGGTRNGGFDEYIIRKLKVNFFQEGKIPENSMSIPFERGRTEGDFARERPRPVDSVAQQNMRRERMLKRYFPVTLVLRCCGSTDIGQMRG